MSIRRRPLVTVLHRWFDRRCPLPDCRKVLFTAAHGSVQRGERAILGGNGGKSVIVLPHSGEGGGVLEAGDEKATAEDRGVA